MAPRAYWKGYLKLSLVSCPIALFPATSESEKISFHQLNKKTGHRIKYRKVDAETADEVDWQISSRAMRSARATISSLIPRSLRLSQSRASIGLHSKSPLAVTLSGTSHWLDLISPSAISLASCTCLPIECTRCTRKGQYSLAKLIAQHGHRAKRRLSETECPSPARPLRPDLPRPAEGAVDVRCRRKLAFCARVL